MAKKRDTNETAKAIVDLVTQAESEGKSAREIQGSVPAEEMPLKNAAAELGRRGGLKGGKARAARMDPDERRGIARQAALARWGERRQKPPTDRIPTASHRGPLMPGVECFVLDDPIPDPRRVIHKRGMAKAIGLKSGGGNVFMRTMSRTGLGSIISEELKQKLANPIVFNAGGGDPGHGYEATVLIDVCEAIRVAYRQGLLKPSQLPIALQAEAVLIAAAKLGINALVDEVTGYIADKRKNAYREMFRDFIREEVRKWEQEFPEDFFSMIYQLYGLRQKNPGKHPGFFAHFIRKYIYTPLANSHGAILAELDVKNPVVYDKGGRRHKMHSFLTEEVGLKALRAHLWQVIGIGNSATSKRAFDEQFQRAFPGAQYDLFGRDDLAE